jgi:hypothetical protein
MLESRFETLMPNPAVELARLLAHTGIVVDGYEAPAGAPLTFRVPTTTWEAIMDANSFQKLTAGRAKGEESRSSHLRSGVAGDWRNHFTPPVTAKFKALYPGMVPALGYEADDDWK